MGKNKQPKSSISNSNGDYVGRQSYVKSLVKNIAELSTNRNFKVEVDIDDSQESLREIVPDFTPQWYEQLN